MLAPGATGRRRGPTASASVPRQTSSNRLVSSRAITTRRSPPHAAARSPNVAATRFGASKSTVVRGSAATSASRSARSRPARQEALHHEPGRRQPRHHQRREHRARPRHHLDREARPPRTPAPAARPGRRSRACPRRSRTRPGRPPRIRSTSSAARVRSLCSCTRDEPRPAGHPRVGQQAPGAPGVLGRDHVGRPQRLDRAGRQVAEVADRRGDQHERALTTSWAACSRTSTPHPGSTPQRRERRRPRPRARTGPATPPATPGPAASSPPAAPRPPRSQNATSIANRIPIVWTCRHGAEHQHPVDPVPPEQPPPPGRPRRTRPRPGPRHATVDHRRAPSTVPTEPDPVRDGLRTSHSDVEADLHHVAVARRRSPCPRPGACRRPWPWPTIRGRAAPASRSPRPG